MIVVDKQSDPFQRHNLESSRDSTSDPKQQSENGGVSVEQLAAYLDVQLHIPKKIQVDGCAPQNSGFSCSPSPTPPHSSLFASSSSSSSVSSLSSQTNTNNYPTNVSSHNQHLNGICQVFKSGESISHENHAASSTTKCSVLKRTDPEITVEELAGYFDLQLHIPRKMSYMAELMYT